MIRFSGAVLVALGLFFAAGCSDYAPEAGGGPGSARDADAAPPKVNVTKVVLNQGVDVPLLVGSKVAPAGRMPAVAGRAGILRVFVDAPNDEESERRKLKARLKLEGSEVSKIDVDARIEKASTDGDLDSTINFEIPAGVLDAETKFSIEFRAADAKSWTKANTTRFPKAPIAVGAKEADEFEVRVLPVTLDGKAPRLDATALQELGNAMTTMMPLSSARLSVAAPIAFDGSRAVTTDAEGLSAGGIFHALDMVRARHFADTAVAPKVVYLGIVCPPITSDGGYDQSFGEASGVAYAGLDVGSGGDAIVGGFCPDAGFDDPATRLWDLQTAVHELSHAIGLDHAPCGEPDLIDQAFPYPNGQTGTWGYDILTKQLHDPSRSTDIMGYCENVWVSDYSFARMFGYFSGTPVPQAAAGPSARRLFVD